jgi:hypothetical protein
MMSCCSVILGSLAQPTSAKSKSEYFMLASISFVEMCIDCMADTLEAWWFITSVLLNLLLNPLELVLGNVMGDVDTVTVHKDVKEAISRQILIVIPFPSDCYFIPD